MQHVVATNVALKIACRRHVTRIDLFCATILYYIQYCNIEYNNIEYYYYNNIEYFVQQYCNIV